MLQDEHKKTVIAMKNKDLNELKNKSIENLKKIIADQEKEEKQTRLKLKIGKIKNVHLANQKRKDIAKIKTIIAEKNFMEVIKNQK
ncbi:50S ribosomal protein L29 [Candidatus Curtissbacteria bacterium RIFCSPHIGHO2_01_FULL_41_44]|nr:MAG: 50S ribosomal protein L29 [Candidatus Curtissbacteria bacterium RIFCSPHIGHO2_02_FULL_42_58]OGD94764.1 MAG: 50S ribosomal protein L29 [Candidatus Curtissbacteria bacterium RIFCSPHIGHO2_01_FULL_41_44]OGD96308.1 MAG: 50S ribosomal protein L29 [Candidatus Curtissbacteria bacterium RIFCSPHIGHO2_12_FULL_42_33]OGE02964.1 MAG: 50S ribosomal protein L29 [Candidatus Curtissbacteria bacterium RIFCSPLOWO2_12_FULL_41_16]OGE10737.1 MAG: 50S ribosomal protein L29 [Candidatus Curtissbacteria bacterium 